MSKEIKRIKLTIENPGGVDRKAWPITQGVPFAEGDLERGSPVRAVRPDGEALPTQATCLATWNRDMKYVKWLLVDFQADLEADKTGEYFLEYGPGVKAVAPEHGVSTERSGERIRIDTGELRLDFRVPASQPRPPVASFQRARDFLSGCWVKSEDRWHDLFRGDPGPHLYLVDTQGQVYDSCTAAPTPRVEVEEEGPMRVCVSVKGFHATENGIHLCPFTLRVHLYAGKRDVRMFHTFVFDQDPEVLAFSEVGMRFPLDLGDDLRMSFGGQDRPHWATRWEEGHFLQDSDLSYWVERDGEPFGEGEKTRGWTTLCGSRASALVALRDLWQQYPKGYRLTQDGLDVQFWPSEYEKPLVYSTAWKEDCVFFNGLWEDPPAKADSRDEAAVKQILERNPTAPLNLKSFVPSTTDDVRWIEEMVEKYAPDRPASHNDTGTRDGTGAAKTTEFWLSLSPEPIDDESAEAFAICVQEPVIAPPPPEYTYRTEATRGHYYAGDERFAEVDAALDQFVETLVVEPWERCRLYGMMRYGNLVCSHAGGPGLSYHLYCPTDPVKALKYVGPYNNETNDQVWSLWGNFVRTAKRHHFLLASAYSQTMADVTVCHAHPSHPEYIGLMHYHNAHQWTGIHSPSHTLTLGIMLHYYFTGNRRLLEVALEAADWAVRNQEPAGIITERSSGGKREFTGPLVCVIEAYLATWAEKYGGLARRSLNWFLRTQPKPGLIPYAALTLGELGDEAEVRPCAKPAQHDGVMFSIYYEGIRHFNSDLLKETILAEADHIVWEEPVSGFFTLDMARECLPPRSKLWPVGNGWHWTNRGGPPQVNYGIPADVAVAYDLTKDPIYAAWAKYHVLTFFTDKARRVENRPPTFTNVAFGSYIPLLMSTVARAMDHDPEGFAQAEAEWRRKRAEMGHAVYDGPFPGIPFDFDPNANVKSMEPVEI